MILKVSSLRCILVQYAQGFASRIQIKQNLTLPLYCLSVIFLTSIIFCTHFFPLISKAKEENITDLFHLFIGFADYNSDNHFKMILGLIPCLTIMLTSFIYIQIIKTRFRKKYLQINIVTFNQNFYFYIIFILAQLTLILIRVNILKFDYGKNAKILLVYVYLAKLCVDWFIRPSVILILLRKNMSDFFEDFDSMNQKNHSFILKGVTVAPRQQKFLSFMPFCQNARWGSSKKFLSFTDHGSQNNNFSRRNQKHFSNEISVIS